MVSHHAIPSGLQSSYPSTKPANNFREPQTATEAMKPESEVFVSLSVLESTVHEVECLARALQSELEPVLKPTGALSSGIGALVPEGKEGCAPLTRRIDAVSDRLEGLRQMLLSLRGDLRI